MTKKNTKTRRLLLILIICMLKVCLHCGLHASLGSLLSPEQVNGVYHSVYIHKQPNCAKVEEVELQMSFLWHNAIKKPLKGSITVRICTFSQFPLFMCRLREAIFCRAFNMSPNCYQEHGWMKRLQTSG